MSSSPADGKSRMRNVSPQNLTDKIVSKRVPLEIRLETDSKNFKRIEAQFITDLATALGTNPEEIRKIKILSGCVRFFFDLPFDVAQKFKEALAEKPLPIKLQELFQTYNIDFRNTKFDVVEEAPYVKRLLLASDELRKDGRILTWLHLSDVHFQNQPGAMKWSQDQVKESFIKRLPDLLAAWDLAPDMLFFTGDIAYSGAVEQYDVANGFLKQVEEVLGKKIRTYVVPGNHDVSWDKIDSFDARMRKSLTDQYEVTDLLLNTKNDSKRSKTFARFEHFTQFLNDNFNRNGRPTFQDEYFYVDQFDHLGLRLGIAGLNSAWLSTRKTKTTHDQDLGELLLGEPQVFKSAELLNSSQIKFALLHHPPESMWFKDFDRRMQRAFLPKFDFILRGHEHEPTTQATTNIMTDDEYIHFASGALYDATEMRGKTGYPISFNAVRLNLDSGKGIIFYWRYFSDIYKWTRDIIVDDGFKVFDIPDRVLRRLEAQSDPDPPVQPKGAGVPIPKGDKNPTERL